MKPARMEGLEVLLVGNYAPDGQQSMGRFVQVLARELPACGVQLHTLYPEPIFGRFHPSPRGIGKWLGYVDKFMLFPSRLRRHIRRCPTDSLVHICDHSNAVYAPMLNGTANLVTCHDLLAIRSALGEFSGHRTRGTGRVYQRWILRGLNAARHVACVSKATRGDLLRLSQLRPVQTSVIHNGLNYPYRPIPAPALHQRVRELAARVPAPSTLARLQGGFILHVGGNQWYKNRLGALQIYADVCAKRPKPPTLVMVGKPFTPSMRGLISAHGLQANILELNEVNNEELRTLYSAAELLLFPSWVEGFGWPIIEAQACGCRVAINHRPPMSDVAGNGAVLLDLPSTEVAGQLRISTPAIGHAGNAILQMLSATENDRQNLVERGFRNAARYSTAGMIEAYTDAYRQVLAPVVAEQPGAPVPV